MFITRGLQWYGAECGGVSGGYLTAEDCLPQGKYRLGRKIGSGSFGDIYIGENGVWSAVVCNCGCDAGGAGRGARSEPGCAVWGLECRGGSVVGRLGPGGLSRRPCEELTRSGRSLLTVMWCVYTHVTGTHLLTGEEVGIKLVSVGGGAVVL